MRALGIVGLCLFVFTAAGAWGENMESMLARGRFAEAYEATRSNRSAGPEAYAKLAEALLQIELASEDSYDRWFSLQAIRGLNERVFLRRARGLAAGPDLYQASLALEYLAGVDDDPGVFLDALRSSRRPLRLRALQRLESLPGPAVTAALQRVLDGDRDPSLRAHAAHALGSHGSPRTLEVLRRHLLEDHSQLVREECVRALARLSAPHLADTLRQRVAVAVDRNRVLVARLVGLAGDPTLIDDIAPWLADADVEVRTAAAGAILALRGARGASARKESR